MGAQVAVTTPVSQVSMATAVANQMGAQMTVTTPVAVTAAIPVVRENSADQDLGTLPS